jgi:hypothetical protein
MAAWDRFSSFNSSLALKDREALKDLVRSYTQELLAARSEDARVRIVHQYILDVNKTLQNAPQQTR